jgi:hypothetical protein
MHQFIIIIRERRFRDDSDRIVTIKRPKFSRNTRHTKVRNKCIISNSASASADSTSTSSNSDSGSVDSTAIDFSLLDPSEAPISDADFGTYF